jgi:hypothetical protein
MRKLGLIFITALVFVGCKSEKKTTTPTVIYSACSISDETAGKCMRYMDRDIYFVDNASNIDGSLKNNPLDIQKIQTSLTTFSCLTKLGCNYFRFHTATENDLKPITSYTTGVKFKSFIQVYPDQEFSDLYNELKNNGINVSLDLEPNVLLIYSPANRRQFYMIVKEACLSNSNNSDCTNGDNVPFTSDAGLTALFGRNMGRMVGIHLDQSEDCLNGPTSGYVINPMCGKHPSNAQWTQSQRDKMTGMFDNALETISLNNNYYNETFVEQE